MVTVKSEQLSALALLISHHDELLDSAHNNSLLNYLTSGIRVLLIDPIVHCGSRLFKPQRCVGIPSDPRLDATIQAQLPASMSDHPVLEHLTDTQSVFEQIIIRDASEILSQLLAMVQNHDYVQSAIVLVQTVSENLRSISGTAHSICAELLVI